MKLLEEMKSASTGVEEMTAIGQPNEEGRSLHVRTVALVPVAWNRAALHVPVLPARIYSSIRITT
jgi:hypothetical protein